MNAFQIMEEIINEVSIGKWKEAATSSLPKRQEEAEAAKKAVEQGWEEYDKQARKHPEEEPALYRLAQANDEAGVKAEDRADHAKDVAGIKVNDKVGANKAIKAAKKVSAKREDDFGRAPSARTLKRSAIANRLVYADPKYKNEALEITEDILEETKKSPAQRRKEEMDFLHLGVGSVAKPQALKNKEEAQDKEKNPEYKLGNPVKLPPVKEALEIMEEILEELNIVEDLESTITKKYGPMFGDKATPQGSRLHSKLISTQTAELLDAAKRNLPDEEKNSSSAIGREMNRIEAKRILNKNIKGEARTDYRRPGSLYDQIKELDNRKEDKENGYKKTIEKSIKRHEKKNLEEALEIMEAILDEISPIFELDYENKQNVNTNKIRKLKKDKDGENVEVVSVADELFPYEGNAKQQFNQKVLAKINDMIEGKGSLEDLIQFVRKYSGNKKATNENTEISEEGKEPNKECEYRKAEWEKASNNYFETKKKHLDWEGKHPETKKAYEEERKAYANLDKARRDSKKINGPYEALELMEDLYSQIKKVYGEPEYKYNKDSGLEPANKSAELMYKTDDVRGKEYSQEKEKNPDIDLYKKRLTTKNTRGKNNTEYRSSKYRKFSDDWRLPKTDDERIEGSIRRHNERVKESLKEALEILEKYTQEQRKEAAKKVLKDRMLDFYDKYYELEDTVPTKGDMEDFKRKEKRYKHAEKIANEALQDQVEKKLANREISLDKAFELAKKIKANISPEKQAEDSHERLNRMAKELGVANPDNKAIRKSIKRAKRKGSYVGEALEEILQITENIFGYNDGRGDLLDDIDTTLGSPVKKAFKSASNKVVKNIIGCKQKKVK